MSLSVIEARREDAVEIPDGHADVVGTIYVHDASAATTEPSVLGLPSLVDDELDEQGFGPVLLRCRARRPLHVGDEVRLPDGEVCDVVRCRNWLSGWRSWRQSVQLGRPHPHTAALHLNQLQATG